ncbi:hypothetical protein OY671_009415, partial [Metschnikowia pulcherrima]
MEVVHRRLALEARRSSRYTNASAVQVAAESGFDDPSYFSRFYRRMTGFNTPPSSRFAPFAPERDPAMDRRADAGGKGLEREEARFRDFPSVRPGRVVGSASHHFDAVAPPAGHGDPVGTEPDRSNKATPGLLRQLAHGCHSRVLATRKTAAGQHPQIRSSVAVAHQQKPPVAIERQHGADAHFQTQRSPQAQPH